tara:strand:- start:1884 stop:2060 length:177 start_codon:yes stop_codon:yes gene_type:complete
LAGLLSSSFLGIVKGTSGFGAVGYWSKAFALCLALLRFFVEDVAAGYEGSYFEGDFGR